MPTAVLDLDFKNLPEKIEELTGYQKAFILLRYSGRPIGKVTVPVINDSIVIDEFYELFIESCESLLMKNWMNDKLAISQPEPVPPLPKATIAVCTRNRPEDLRRCIESLLKLPDDGQEILIIDNGPSDDQTRHLVAEFSHIRYVHEPRAGLNIARNRALQEATHDVVAFTDDDAMPDANWLRALVRNFDHPHVMCVTGMTMPFELETPAQEAFEKYSPFGKGFSKKMFRGDTVTHLSAGHIGAGANMALRKKVTTLVGYFDNTLDAGTPTKSGGDHEFFVRILLKGFHIVYEPEALSWHKHRRGWTDTINTINGYGTGVYAYWTKLFLSHNEPGVVKLAYGWFMHNQLPDLIRAFFRRPNHRPMSFLIAELKGCIVGPWKYLLSQRRSKKGGQHD